MWGSFSCDWQTPINYLGKIQEKKSFMLDKLYLFFLETSTTTILYEVVCCGDFGNLKILCYLGCIKKKQMVTILTFLSFCNKDGKVFFKHIVAGDEIWISYNSRNQTPLNGKATFLLSIETNESKLELNSKKVIAAVLWDQIGILLICYMSRGITIAFYAEIWLIIHHIAYTW